MTSATLPLLGFYGGGLPGSIARLRIDEAWLHRPIPGWCEFLPRDNWTNILNAKNWATALWKTEPGRLKVIAIPLLADTDAGDLAGAANGAQDAHYSAMCDNFIGVKPLVLRVGWEGNGNWYGWGMAAPGHANTPSVRAPQYIAAFRRFVAIARVKLPGVLINWSVACSGDTTNPTYNLYPGDDVVDIIGMDVYNSIYNNLITDETARFNTLRDMAYGLKWQVAFAATHRKVWAWDEWGSGSKIVTWPVTYDTSADSPIFIQKMFDWSTTGYLAYKPGAPPPVYINYFDFPAGDGLWNISPNFPTGKQFPLQSAKFLSLFGAPAMSDLLVDDVTDFNTKEIAFRAAQSTLANAISAATAQQAVITQAQADVDAKKIVMVTAANKLATDAAAA